MKIERKDREIIFENLCRKAREASSMAKLGGCHSLYRIKANAISQLISHFPGRVHLLDVDCKYWLITIVGFGQIHILKDELDDHARKIIELQHMEVVSAEVA